MCGSWCVPGTKQTIVQADAECSRKVRRFLGRGESPSACYDLQRYSNGWITSAPAARATVNLLRCVGKRCGVAAGDFLRRRSEVPGMRGLVSRRSTQAQWGTRIRVGRGALSGSGVSSRWGLGMPRTHQLCFDCFTPSDKVRSSRGSDSAHSSTGGEPSLDVRKARQIAARRRKRKQIKHTVRGLRGFRSRSAGAGTESKPEGKT